MPSSRTAHGITMPPMSRSPEVCRFLILSLIYTPNALRMVRLKHVRVLPVLEPVGELVHVLRQVAQLTLWYWPTMPRFRSAQNDTMLLVWQSPLTYQTLWLTRLVG